MARCLDDGSVDVVRDRDGGSSSPRGGSPSTRSKTIEPGTIDYHAIEPGVTPFVKEIGPGINLPNVLEFSIAYEMKQAVRWGLNPSDLSRTAANPTSAAALMVSNEGKREYSAQVAAVFRKHDLELLELAAIVAKSANLGSFPQRGYSIQYRQIPRSPGEEAEFRDDLDWRKKRGLMSRVDVYRATYPGTTEDDAIAALVKVAGDEKKLTETIGPAEPIEEPPNARMPPL